MLPGDFLLSVCFLEGSKLKQFYGLGWNSWVETCFPGGDPVLWGATVLAHVQPRWGRVITLGSKTFQWQESWKSLIEWLSWRFSLLPLLLIKILSLQCSALFMTCAVRCRTHFSFGKISTNHCTFGMWGIIFQYPVSLFRCFWLTTCSTVSLVIIPPWCQTESYLVIIMHVLHITVFFAKSNQIIFEKSRKLYCEQT